MISTAEIRPSRPLRDRICVKAIHILVVVGLMLCAGALPGGVLQIVAWMKMANDAGGLSKLEQVMVSEPACELCKTSRQLATGQPDERRERPERASWKLDLGTVVQVNASKARADEWPQELVAGWGLGRDHLADCRDPDRPLTPPPQGRIYLWNA